MRLTKWLGVLLAASLCYGADDLQKRFTHPPETARPWVYWFWINGNLTREGITADLEAMHRAGIGGAFLMEIDSFVPAGPVRFFTPEWRAIFQHAMKEATRLGIDVAMNNDAGWMGSGGPWVKPEESMQMTVASETHARGGRHFSALLARPKTNEGYFRDIAVLAFPTPAAEVARILPAITVDGRAVNAERLTDGNAATLEELPEHAPARPWSVEITYPRPFSARSLTIAPDRPLSVLHGVIEASEDGHTYKPVREFDARWPIATVNFAPVSARHFRVRLSLEGRAPATLPLGELAFSGGARVEGLTGKAAYVTEPDPGVPTPASAGAIARTRILDITQKMDAEGRLNWDAPAGDWTILRVGYTSTGKRNHPAPKEGIGLECDKLSTAAIDSHFSAFLGQLLADERAVGAHALRYAHIDSWESGSQNWTARFREEFRARRGYDMTPYLPVMFGRIVDSSSASERFLWDVRRTVADLITDNYARRFAELSHKNGLQFSLEGYGAGPLDDLAYGATADLPMAEFWNAIEPGWGVKLAASGAHVAGRPVLAAEAFTSRAPAGRWMNHPYRLKPLGDQALTLGVNQIVFHRFIAQPWLNRPPGMSMGPYGVEIDRTATWWEQSKPYLTYLARCQEMLRQGRFVADILYLDSERVGRDFQAPSPLTPAPPAGYDYDVVPAGILEKASVKDGRILLPAGMSYRVLVLPQGRGLRLAQMRKIRDLVAAGATVLGAPPVASPSLAEAGAGDAEIQRIAADLWKDCDGGERIETRHGMGRVIWGKPLATVLADQGAPPDFSSLGAEAGRQIRSIHRRVDNRDLYFLASAESAAVTALCTFRVTGKRPQLWWPDSGRVEPVAIYDQQPGVTRIPIHLDPYGSVFVVFEDAPADPVVSLTRNRVELSGLTAIAVGDLGGKLADFRLSADNHLETSVAGAFEARTAAGQRFKALVDEIPPSVEIAGPWELSFPDGWGAPPHVTLPQLISWPAHADNGVKYFSGTATYRRSVTIPSALLGEGRTLYLDLGQVAVIAEVKLNGQNLGILWKPPFRVEISSAARAGDNDLEVRVTNLWPNRLIGDEQLPADMDWEGPRLLKWPQWLLDGRPSPTGRLTTITRRHWYKDDPLADSGLLGPVRLEPAVIKTLTK
jgi:hypothetical protein